MTPHPISACLVAGLLLALVALAACGAAPPTGAPALPAVGIPTPQTAPSPTGPGTAPPGTQAPAPAGAAPQAPQPPVGTGTALQGPQPPVGSGLVQPITPAPGGSAMQIISTAFSEGSSIPRQYTCDGANISPPLAWQDVPAGAQSLALIVADPDAPSGTFYHWLIFNLPASSAGLPEGLPPTGATVPAGAVQGTSSFRKPGYGGPCPPSGVHRYYFTLYALDTRLGLQARATASDLQAAMQGHLLAQARLMGRYRRG